MCKSIYYITNDGVQYNQIKQEIREKLSNYFYSSMGSKPMIIAVVQEFQEDKNE